MDHVYCEIQNEDWKLPDSEYVDDSESPLSLLTPIKELSPSSNTSEDVTPTNSQQKKSSSETYATATTYCLSYPQSTTHVEIDKEERGYNSRQHDHIIASNERITCVRPQSVSILWSNNTKTTIHIESAEDDEEEEESDSSIASSSSRNEEEEREEEENKSMSEVRPLSPAPSVRPILPPQVEEKEGSVIVDSVEEFPKKKKKKHPAFNFNRTRTITSYDSQTSLYLKSVFFNVYSKQKKLTKEQRAEVQRRTGLNSRNITYWFSNHKRRFKDALKVYRKAVEESGGEIKDYQDFIHWRRAHNLPDQVTQDELN